MDLVDYHIHSEFSYCSEDITIAKVAHLASRKGLKDFFITDHSSHLYFDEEASWRYDYLKNPKLFKKVKHNSKKMEEYISRIHQFSSQKARVGLEVDCIFEGDLIFDSDYREDVEILIGSIHRLPCLWGTPSLKQLTKEFLYYTALLLEKDIDILGHPTRVFRGAGFKVPQEVIVPVIDKALQEGVALEINSHLWKDPSELFIKEALKRGAKISFGTDSHNIKEIEEFGNFDYHLTLLAKCGIEKEEELYKVLYAI